MADTAEVYDLDGVTQENVGDLLVYGYADYLRRYDALTEQAAAFATASEDKLREGAEPFTTNVQFDALNGLSAEEINALEIEDVAKDALARSQMFLGAVMLLGLEQIKFKSDVGRSEENGVFIPLNWPTGHSVRIESLVSDNGVIEPLVVSGGVDKALVKSRRKEPSVVEGELWMVESLTNGSGMLHLLKRHRSLMGRYVTHINVGPIIDRKNGYKSNVKVTVLD